MKIEEMIEPIRGRILVRLIKEGMTDSGIALPDGVRLKNRAQVIAVGGGHISGGAIIPLAVKPGDFVIAHIPAGSPIVHSDEQGDVVLADETMVACIDRRPPEAVNVIHLAERSSELAQLTKSQRKGKLRR